MLYLLFVPIPCIMIICLKDCNIDTLYVIHEAHFIYLMLMFIFPFVLSIKVLFISIKESNKMKILTKSDMVNVYLDFVVNLKVDGRYNNQ